MKEIIGLRERLFSRQPFEMQPVCPACGSHLMDKCYSTSRRVDHVEVDVMGDPPDPHLRAVCRCGFEFEMEVAVL